MANVTDPLAAFLHGTDPQNLMECITRQKIYDCRYWKEECFGLTAVNVLEKACTLKCIGASFGGNRQPTKFLCLVLKLLQIQPTDDLVEEFLQTPDFKYVTALGAFYKRVTGRPADIYQSLEPLYLDYRKLRIRNVNDWSILHMDEFVHSLLTEERVCGIALPRLPQRRLLVEEGYLEGPRTSALSFLFTNHPSMSAREYLEKKVEEGSVAAKALWESRRNKSLQTAVAATPRKPEGNQGYYGPSDKNESGKSRNDFVSLQMNKRLKKEQYGTLFKSTQSTVVGGGSGDQKTSTRTEEEGSDEYWNKERAKLGLKPLRK